ncbi:MAG: hypothetical protein RL721_2426, partial [Candidatus Eisenbacteria bacterium]
MASKTSKTSPKKSRTPARTRAARPTRTTARRRTASASSAGPRANGAFAAQMRDFAASYPADRERRDLYPYTLSGEPIAPLYGPEHLAGM